MTVSHLLTRLLTGAGLVLWSVGGYGQVESVHIASRLDPNAIIITGVDIVFVYSPELVESLPPTKADWYAGKREFVSAAGDALDVVSVFIPQGFDSLTPVLPGRRSEALGVWAFARHDDATAPPVKLSDMRDVLIEIDQFGIIVSRRDRAPPV